MRLRRFYFPLLALLLLVLAGESGWMYWDSHRPKESIYDPIIVQVGREEGVDPFLIRALIWRESHFDPTTFGTAQEHGLMQVRPIVGQEWAKAHKIADFKDDDLFNPETNIRAGTWYLSRALKRWTQTDSPPHFALAEYNAGRTNALKWVDPNDPANHMSFMERITFRSTKKYVESILAKRAEYRLKMADNRWYRGVSTSDPTLTQAP